MLYLNSAMPQLMWSAIMQTLIVNQQGMTMNQVADVCCRRMESDSMLLFLRAVAASRMAADKDSEAWGGLIREVLPISYR